MHVREAVKQLNPYRPGRPLRDLERYGVTDGVKLGSNENPLGPAPEVLAAMREAVGETRLYPEPGAPLLREALAHRHGRLPGEIIAGAGIDDLLDLTARVILDPGDNLVMARPGFIRYAVAANAAGGEVREIPGPPEAPYTHDLDAMLAAVDARTRAVVLVNPNNPTGSIFNREALAEFLARVPEHVLTIYDEAYFEFVEDADYPDGFDHLDCGKPFLLFRTFSKAHSLAGLRIGFGAGPPDLIGYLDRARLPFNVSNVAQAAAIAALDTPDHLRRTRELARAETRFLAEGLSARGWKVEPTWTNFVFAEAPVPGTDLADALMRRGFILRPLTSFGLPDRFFRVSHGTREQDQRFLAALDEAVLESRAS